MPRKTRIYLPRIPAHVVQRGHNRNACFFADDDCLFYLECSELYRDPAARQYAYRELLKRQLPEAQLHDIRDCLAHNFPLGNDRFREAIETALCRRVVELKQGRPRAQCGCSNLNHHDPFCLLPRGELSEVENEMHLL